jgi:hypothetical protein
MVIGDSPDGIDVLASRDLGDGRVIEVVSLTYGRSRLCVGQRGTPFYDHVW